MKLDDTWYNLDNQAIIYPAVSDSKNTNVFRLSCTLKEPIRPVTLQQSLDTTMMSFPYYLMTIRRGLFWYYLDHTEQKPIVEMEHQRPCNEIFHIQDKGLLFKVTYYGNRINLEMFHVLADGGGAMELFRSLIYNYLIKLYKDELSPTIPVLNRSANPTSQASDSFKKYYTQGKKLGLSKYRSKKTFTFDGTNLPYNGVQIISVKVSTKQILQLVKSKKATLTTYLATILICGIESEMMLKRYLNRDISINMPVDLRTMFPSQTFRNFFSTVDLRYNFGDSPKDFDAVLDAVTAQLKAKVTPENLVQTLNYNMSVQENYFTRVVPLFIKNRILKFIYKQNEKNATTTLSNVGRIFMPPELTGYISDFHCLLNPTPANKIKLCITSFEDEMVLNVTSRIIETDLQRYVIRHLTNSGINTVVTTNWSDSDETL